MLKDSLVQRFEWMVREYPDRIAVTSKGQQMTYQELNRGANRLAHLLLAQRGPGSEAIAFLLEHHLPAIVAIWGILKAGKGYVALDTSLPVERLHLIMEDVQARILLTSSKHLATAQAISRNQPRLQVINLDEIDHSLPSENLGLKISPETMAYIIYTSGTTGRPKGVIIEHQTAMHNTLTQVNDIYTSPDDRLALFVSVWFDTARFSLYGALLTGAMLCLYDIRSRGVGLLTEWVKEERITILLSLPSTFRRMFDLVPKNLRLSSVRLVTLGGEPTTSHEVELYRKFFSKDCFLLTTLGSTEAGRVTRYIQGHSSQLTGHVVPAGFPMPGKDIFIMDENGQPLALDQVGEIWIRSRYISPGYWNQPELTAEKYTNDPKDASVRIFHTGDLGRLRADGCLEHLGRIDSQVKVRGYRIEVTEIEAILHQHPDVKEAVVLARANPRLPEEKQLVAYLIPCPKDHPDDKVAFSRDSLRLFLAERLPDYMVPAIFVILDSLPLTSTGKVDRLALLAPEDLGQGLERTILAPRNPIESQLVRIWERVLRIQPIGVQDNYFELGGNSLLAAQLFAKIEKTFNRKMPLSILFQASTVEQQAEILLQQDWVPDWSSLVPLRASGSRPPLFFAAPVGGNVLSYRDLMVRLDVEQPCYGLQAVGLDGVQLPLRNIQDVSAHYIQEIKSVQPSGPYYLAGSSFGGLVVYEMAQQLHDLGDPVALVVMFDAYGPNYPQRLPGTSRIKRRIYKLFNRIDTHLGNLIYTGWRGRANYLRAKTNKLFKRLQRRTRNRLDRLFHPLPKELKRVRKAQFEAGNKRNRYTRQPRRFPGRLVLFRASHQPRGVHPDPTLGWGNVVGGNIEVYEIPGHHTSIIYEPRVHLLAARFNQILDEVQKIDRDNLI